MSRIAQEARRHLQCRGPAGLAVGRQHGIQLSVADHDHLPSRCPQYCGCRLNSDHGRYLRLRLRHLPRGVPVRTGHVHYKRCHSGQRRDAGHQPPSIDRRICCGRVKCAHHWRSISMDHSRPRRFTLGSIKHPPAMLPAVAEIAVKTRKTLAKLPVRANAAHRQSDGRYARTPVHSPAKSPTQRLASRHHPPAVRQLAQRPDHERQFVCPSFSPYQRLPVCDSSKGFTLTEIASRARKIRERTVPMGQFIN
jgi:hypothetical protein